MRTTFCIAVLFVVVPGLPAQTTWWVDVNNCPGGSGTQVDPYCQVQDAINAALDGDTVLILPGTYFENIDFLGKAITVTSQSGPAGTILDGSGVDVVVAFRNGEGAGSVLEKLTIQNGDSNVAGGVVTLAGTAPTIRDNVITGCYSEFGAGGINVSDGGTISGNTITGNSSNFGAGGVACFGPAQISGNTISQNGSGFGSGGLHVFGAGAIVDGNVIQANRVFDGGGAGITIGTDVAVRNNQILDNTHTDSEAGGVFCVGADCEISGNWILGNDGGITLELAVNALIQNNIISDSGDYPGIRMSDSSVTIDHTTIHDGGGPDAGGIDVFESTVTVTNTVLWANTRQSAFEIHVLGILNPAVLTIDHSTVQGGQGAVNVGMNSTLHWGAAMLDADPRFVDELNHDLHLTRLSPCINQGVAGALTADVDGDARSIEGTPDMGADEFVGAHLLAASQYTLQELTGGVVNHAVDFGSGAALQRYLVFASFSGTLPGLALPGGQATLPLNYDLVTGWVVRLVAQGSPAVVGFLGTLDGAGQATATLDTLGPLPAGSAGITLSFAAATVSPWSLASNPVNVLIQ